MRNAVEVPVVGADQNAVAGHHRGRLDLGLRLEGPKRLAVGGIHRVQNAGQIAHVHRALGDGRRGFTDAIRDAVLPAQLPGFQVDG